jgi:hypothetical protein
MKRRSRIIATVCGAAAILMVITMATSVATTSGSPRPRSLSSTNRRNNAAATLPNVCQPSGLTAQYWSSFPSLSEQIEGITLVNSSPAPCSLPVEPVGLSVVDASGSEISPVSFPNSVESGWAQDFQNYVFSANAAADYPGLPAAEPAPITLNPGDNAVLVLYGPTSLASNPSALAAPVGGSIAIELATGEPPVTVSIPSFPQLASATDPNGTAFVSYGPVIVSPFISWSQAQIIVGTPTPQSGSGSGQPPIANTSSTQSGSQQLQLVDASVYANAP